MKTLPSLLQPHSHAATGTVCHPQPQPPALCASNTQSHRHCVSATHATTGTACKPHTQLPASCAYFYHSHRHCAPATHATTSTVCQPHTKPPSLCAGHARSDRHSLPATYTATVIVCSLNSHRHCAPATNTPTGAVCKPPQRLKALCACHIHTAFAIACQSQLTAKSTVESCRATAHQHSQSERKTGKACINVSYPKGCATPSNVQG